MSGTVVNIFSLARRIAEAIAEGRLEAEAVKDLTDEQLAEYDTAAYQALKDAQKANEDLANGEE